MMRTWCRKLMRPGHTSPVPSYQEDQAGLQPPWQRPKQEVKQRQLVYRSPTLKNRQLWWERKLTLRQSIKGYQLKQHGAKQRWKPVCMCYRKRGLPQQPQLKQQSTKQQLKWKTNLIGQITPEDCAQRTNDCGDSLLGTTHSASSSSLTATVCHTKPWNAFLPFSTSGKKTDELNNQCPMHNKPHPLVKCRGFRGKLNEKKSLMKGKLIWSKCSSASSVVHLQSSLLRTVRQLSGARSVIVISTSPQYTHSGNGTRARWGAWEWFVAWSHI